MAGSRAGCWRRLAHIADGDAADGKRTQIELGDAEGDDSSGRDRIAVTGSWPVSAHRYDQLAEVPALLHFAQHFARLIPVVVGADRAHAGERDGLVHVLEVLARPDIDALDARLLVQDGGHGERFRRTGEHADLGDGSTHANGAQRAGQRTLAADLDDQVDTVAGRFVHGPAVPVGVVAIVEAGVETEADGAFELLLAARDTEDARAFQPRKLQRKDRDTASSLDEHGAARLHVARRERVPGRNRRTGQRGRLFVAEMARNRDQAILVENDLFGEHAVDVAAQCALHLHGRWRPVKPVLHEDAGHAVADLPACYVFAHGVHFARAVGAWDARQMELGVVKALDHEQVAIVERNRADPHADLAGAWGWG